MSKPMPIEFKTTDGIWLSLYHFVDDNARDASQPRKPVLLLHGASANHGTFTTPGGLAPWLAARNFDPWLLDWRGSGRVVEDLRNHDSLSGKTKADSPRAYNFNMAAQFDIPNAISKIRKEVKDSKVAVVGFCMGGAILAESIALGHVTKADVDCIVLMTLGLFYEAPIDGRLKCEDRILERLDAKSSKAHPLRSVDPRVADAKAQWPKELEDLYRFWPKALKAHSEEAAKADKAGDEEQARKAAEAGRVSDMCNRLSFMYGMPYHHGNLVDEIHGTKSKNAMLPKLFGAIPLHMFIHGARNIRQGQATSYDRTLKNEAFVSDDAHRRFADLTRVTLITGALERLWHRDSIDRMHEWLCRGPSGHLHKFRKHILPGYAHQDLLWGKRPPESVSTDVWKDVFLKIEDGLRAST